MKSNTHKSIHLLAKSKEGSPIQPLKKYVLKISDEEVEKRQISSFIKSGAIVIPVRPHPDGGDSWQVETGQGLIWVPEHCLEPLIVQLGANDA